MKVTINPDKNIGKVIYVVEGNVFEPELLKEIFHDILNYEVYSYNKNNNVVTEFISTKNKYSRIFIVPAKNPTIKNLNINDDYFDCIFNELNKYELDVDNSALYLIFDRDRESNRPTPILKNIQKFSNSRDNGETRNGLFLLSYPSAEAFYLNCFNDSTEFKNGENIKLYLNQVRKELTIDNISEGTMDVIKKVELILKQDFRPSWLDNFKKENEEIFCYQEKYFNKNKVYVTISLLFMSLIDLGIVSISDDDNN